MELLPGITTIQVAVYQRSSRGMCLDLRLTSVRGGGVMTFIILLLCVGWLVHRTTTAVERKRFLELTLRKYRRFVSAAGLRHPQVVVFWKYSANELRRLR